MESKEVLLVVTQDTTSGMNNRNIIMVTADSVRADICGFLSDKHDTTPFLSSKKDESLVFKNAIAPGPRTLSSVPASMTGKHLPMNDDDMTIYENRVARIQQHMTESITLAEKLRERGYQTIGFSTNPWTSKNNDFDSGFDFYEEFEDGEEGPIRRILSNTRFDTPSRFVDQWINNKVWFSQWPTYYDQIKQEIRSSDEPFFLWVFLLDTHNPYFPAKSDRKESTTSKMYLNMLRGNSMFNQTNRMSTHKGLISEKVLGNIKKAYRDSIRSVDRFVETIWNDFQGKDPVIMFHADHGEAFGDHGNYGHQPEVFEENIHVPLIMFNTNVKKEISEPTSLTTIPELLTAASNDNIDNIENQKTYVLSKTENNKELAIRGYPWKFIQSQRGDKLFNLKEDPEENVNMIEEKPYIVEDLRNELAQLLDTLPNHSVKSNDDRAADQGVKDRLDSLGYIS